MYYYFLKNSFLPFSPRFPSPPLIAGAIVRRQTAAAVARTKVLIFCVSGLNMRNTKQCCSLKGGECSLGRS